MTLLSIIRPKEGAAPITLDQILLLLHPDNPTGIGGIEQDLKDLREKFHCPYVVRDYEHFKEILFAFFKHYQITYYDAEITPPAQRDLRSTEIEVRSAALEQASVYEHWKQEGYSFCERYIGEREMSGAARNAIAGREGGMIAIIDNITDAILKESIERYMHSVFFEYVPSIDIQLQIRLAEELMNRCRGLLPGEELLHIMFPASNLEAFITSYAKLSHPLRRVVRW